MHKQVTDLKSEVSTGELFEGKSGNGATRWGTHNSNWKSNEQSHNSYLVPVLNYCGRLFKIPPLCVE